MARRPRKARELRVRVLVFAGARESSGLVRVLQEEGLSYHLCSDFGEVPGLVREGAAGILMTESALEQSSVEVLAEVLRSQPAWSDLPIILLTAGEEDLALPLIGEERLDEIGNVTLLEPPLRPQTLASAVRCAVRARKRQYEVRDLLRQREEAMQRLNLLAEIANYLLLTDQPEEIVHAVFRKIASQLGIEVYLNFLFEPRQHRLRLNAFGGLPTRIAEEHFVVELRPGTKAGEGREEGAHESWRARAVEASTAIMEQLQMSAYVCHPLMANGTLIGTLCFGSRQRPALRAEELAVMETVCDQVSVAIDRKRTEELLQSLNAHLERRVQERTHELQESNVQMESFAYSVSHDLRAPLRAITSFCQLLLAEHAHRLDRDGQDYCQRMAEAAGRMDQLIQDLLEYSRLSRSELTFEQVDLDEVAEKVVDELRERLQEQGAAIEVREPLGTVTGHEPALRQVLMNLLTNALKYTLPEVPAAVVVESREAANGRLRLSVKDEGIGIAPEHHRKIFGVFERLHKDRYPGTGIGLAIVAKAVQRMGGSVGVESEPSKGSHFWIELPGEEKAG